MNVFYKPTCRHDEHFGFPSNFHIVLKANGFWPLDADRYGGNSQLLSKLYSCWCWFNIGVTAWLFFAEIAYCFVNITDVAIAAENLCASLVSGMVLIRMLHMRYEMDSLKVVLLVFVDKIWIKRESHHVIYDRCIQNMMPIAYIGLSLLSALLLYSALPIVVLLTSDQTWQSTQKGLPFYMVLPYDHQRPTYYIITYLGCLYSGCICVAQLYAMDSIFSLFICFVCGQFEILHGRIVRLIPECHAEWSRRYGDEKPETAVNLIELQNLYMKRLDELIKHHNELIRILEDFFQFPLMVNFVISMLQIGFGGFQFLISGRNSFGDFLRFFFYLLSVTGQLYVLCAMGSMLIIRSTHTAQYLFMCNWEGGHISVNSPLWFQYQHNRELEALTVNLPLWRYIDYHRTGKDFQHKLLLMILRSHRPVQLTAMKFAPLSLETFGRILSSSLSYFALLKTFLDKQK